MKRILSLTLWTMFLAPLAYPNGETMSVREKAQGAAGVDNQYVDELKTRDAALEKQSQTQKTRKRMEQNPRNPAMVESFENVETQEEKKVRQKQEAREGEAQGQDYDHPRVWR